MAKKESRKKKKKDRPTVNPDLEGLNIEIDPFGEIRTNYNIDMINAFLNKNVQDKKLAERDGSPSDEPEDKEDKDKPEEE